MNKNKTNTPKRYRGRGFGILKTFLKIFIRKPNFVYLGEKIDKPAIILSNHVGKTAPLKLELYFKNPFRFWGTHEMNDGFKTLYKYQSEVFYHEKKHWNLGLARAFCCIAAPLTYIFYKGLNLISTYRDARFKKTITESIETLNNNCSIILFPEDSSQGYLDHLTGFFGGFVSLANACYKQGVDIPIYATYYKKQTNQHIIDKPVMFSDLIKDGFDRDKIAKQLCDRVNALNEITLPEEEK